MLLPALRSAFTIGRAYLPLANIGLDTVEYWLRSTPESIIPHLPEFLPLLGDYLHIAENTEAEKANEAKSKRTKHAYRVKGSK